MYKCLECGEIFESPKTFKENQGYYGNSIAYESGSCCPHCGGDYAEAYQCEECGEWFTEDEMSNGYCEHCIEKITEDLADAETAYAIANKYDMFERTELNSFLYYAFSQDEIEEILLKELIKSNISACEKVRRDKKNCHCAKVFLDEYPEEVIEFYESEVI